MLTAAIAGTGTLGLILLGLILARLHIRRIEDTHPPRGRFVEVDGVKLHYRRTGKPERPAILVLHGATTNLEEPYMALADAFADEHVIWLDRPGLGWSERPDGPWSPRREAALIDAFLDAHGVRQAIVVGHSWGGAIAMRLAIDHPERVEGLVLVAPALSAWIGRAAWFNAATFWPGFGLLLSHVVVPLTGRRQAAAGAASAFHPEAVPGAYLLRSALPLLLRPSVWRANARDMADVNTHLEQQEEAYGRVAAPAIVLAGKGDTVLWSHRHGAHAAARMPQAEMRWIAGAGHNLHHHHPLAVRDAVYSVRKQLCENTPGAGATA